MQCEATLRLHGQLDYCVWTGNLRLEGDSHGDERGDFGGSYAVQISGDLDGCCADVVVSRSFYKHRFGDAGAVNGVAGGIFEPGFIACNLIQRLDDVGFPFPLFSSWPHASLLKYDLT